MAFVQVKKCLTDPKQLAKLVILVFCICVTIYQLSECVAKINHPPVSTYYKFELNETIKYPSLTICRRPMYKNTLFPNYGVSVTSTIKEAGAFQSFFFHNSTIAGFLSETSYGMLETIPMYGFNGQSNGNAPISYKSIFVLSKGQCHVITPKNNSNIFSVKGGYLLYLAHNAQKKIKDSNGLSTSGFEIYIHGDNEVVTGDKEDSSFMESLYVESGEEVHITLSLQTFEQIPSKSDPCVLDPGYSKSRCEEKCLHNQIAQKLGCTLPWLRDLEENYTQCDNYASVKALTSGFNDMNRTNFMGNCRCVKSCNLSIYTAHVQSRREEEIAKPSSVVNIYFTSNLITTMQEVVGYDWNVFLSDVGASVGFLLGLSVIGAITIVEDFIHIIWKRKNVVKSARIEDEGSVTKDFKFNNTEIDELSDNKGLKTLLDFLNDCEYYGKGTAEDKNVTRDQQKY